jgi:peroxiredoxin
MDFWRRARAGVEARRWRRVGLDLLMVAAVFLGVTSWQTRDLLGRGKPAPDFTLSDLQGQNHALSELRGHKVLLVFWAPWCQVCAAETANLAAVAKDATVVSVALDYQDHAEVERFVQEHDVHYPVLLGSPGLAGAYSIGAFPTAYVIDERGQIAHAMVGYTTEIGLRLRML